MRTATFMLLPSWNKKMTTSPYASLCRKCPHISNFLGTIPSDQLQCAKVSFWKNIQIPLSKHSWELQIIAIWNTKGRVCLNAHNKDWLRNMITETHNLACRMYNFIFVSHNVSLYEMFLIPYKQIRIIHTIFKAISKIGSLGYALSP